MQTSFPLIQTANQGGHLFCEFAVGMFVQVSIMVLLLIPLDYVLRTRCRVNASLCYALWLLVLVKLVLPPSLAVPTGIGYWLADDDSPSNRVVTEDMPGDMPAVSEHATGATAIVGPSLEPRQVRPRWQGVLFGLWLGVVTWLLLLLIRRHVVMRWEIRRAQVAPKAVVDCVQACCATLELRRPVTVKLSETVRGPVVYGFRRSIILLPASLPGRLSPEGLKAVLGHELIHVGRRDTWVHLLQSVLQIFYFYHPLVWLANEMIGRSRELAVDETVLATLDIKVTQYANVLIDVAEMAYQKPAWGVRFVCLAESRESLQRRITHMFERKSFGRVRLGWIGTMVIVAIGALLIPMGRGEPVESNPESNPEANLESNPEAQANVPALPEGIGELFGVDEKIIIFKRFGMPKDIFQGDRHYTLQGRPAEACVLVYDDMSFHIRKGIVEAITLMDEKYVFGNGIHVGDSDRKIMAAFGPDFTLQEAPANDLLIYEDLGLSFEIHKPDRIARKIEIDRRSMLVPKHARRAGRLDATYLDEFGKRFVEAADNGDSEAIRKLFITEDELKATMTSTKTDMPPYSSMKKMFDASVQEILPSLKGAKFVRMNVGDAPVPEAKFARVDVKYGPKPVRIKAGTRLKSVTFHVDTLVTDNTSVIVNIGGVEREVKLDELIMVDGDWRLLEPFEMLPIRRSRQPSNRSRKVAPSNG